MNKLWLFTAPLGGFLGAIDAAVFAKGGDLWLAVSILAATLFVLAAPFLFEQAPESVQSDMPLPSDRVSSIAGAGRPAIQPVER